MKISTDEIEKMAHLARLEIEDPLKEALSGQLSHILDYIDTLKDVNVEGVIPASGAAFLNNVLREDVPGDSPGPEVTLANAPERDQDFYTVPRVV
jgi:aspartyl-tRNA(Asn)/glutamyl-tRNA(Gln) amidotransferase subunit C